MTRWLGASSTHSLTDKEEESADEERQCFLVRLARSPKYAGKPDFAKKAGLGLMVNGWAADWPDGFGFLSQIVDSRVIRASGGNTNLSVKIRAVDALIDKALVTTDVKQREAIWPQIDKLVMEQAVVLPGVWARGLLYRPPSLTNVFVNDGFQMYDYVSLGAQK